MANKKWSEVEQKDKQQLSESAAFCIIDGSAGTLDNYTLNVRDFILPVEERLNAVEINVQDLGVVVASKLDKDDVVLPEGIPAQYPQTGKAADMNYVKYAVDSIPPYADTPSWAQGAGVEPSGKVYDSAYVDYLHNLIPSDPSGSNYIPFANITDIDGNPVTGDTKVLGSTVGTEVKSRIASVSDALSETNQYIGSTIAPTLTQQGAAITALQNDKYNEADPAWEDPENAGKLIGATTLKYVVDNLPDLKGATLHLETEEGWQDGEVGVTGDIYVEAIADYDNSTFYFDGSGFIELPVAVDTSSFVTSDHLTDRDAHLSIFNSHSGIDVGAQTTYSGSSVGNEVFNDYDNNKVAHIEAYWGTPAPTVAQDGTYCALTPNTGDTGDYDGAYTQASGTYSYEESGETHTVAFTGEWFYLEYSSDNAKYLIEPAEGYTFTGTVTVAPGIYSLSQMEGASVTAPKNVSLHGTNNIAFNDNAFVIGQYNDPTQNTEYFSVGGGSAINSRKNVFGVTPTGAVKAVYPGVDAVTGKSYDGTNWGVPTYQDLIEIIKGLEVRIWTLENS